MHPIGTRPYRAAIVARTRFVEDLLVDEDIGQYVLLGAGLDTFAQRHAELAGRVRVFEIHQPGPQAWKRGRLDDSADHLRLIPVDLERDGDSWQALVDAGFDTGARGSCRRAACRCTSRRRQRRRRCAGSRGSHPGRSSR